MKKMILAGAILASILTACGSSGSSSSAVSETNTSETNTSVVVNGVEYSTINGYSAVTPTTQTIVTGIRGIDNSSNVYISGIYGQTTGDMSSGIIYSGPISTVGGKWYMLNYPSSTGVTVTSTSLYGPNNGAVSGSVQIVGNYTTKEKGASAIGLLYEGPLDGSGSWTTLLPPSPDSSPVLNTIAHSTMGGLVVGNYDTNLSTGKAFIYNIATKEYFDLTKVGAKSITAYGIWHNGGTSYTIAGGYSDIVQGLTTGYLVDWDSVTNTATNWTTFNYLNDPLNSIISHFEGITSDGNGGYNLASNTGSVTTITSGAGVAFVNVPRNANKTFGTAKWTNLAYPNSNFMSGNTVYQKNVLGVYKLNGGTSVYSYLATILQ